MKKLQPRTPGYQRADMIVRFGSRAKLSAKVKVTSGGLLSIATLVSTILLSTAVLVHTAVKDGARVVDR